MIHLRKQWFLIGLAVALLVGLAFAHRLTGVVDRPWIKNVIVAGVLFLSTLVLETQAIWNAVRRPGAMLLGTFVNFVMLPLFAWSLYGRLQHDLGIGLMVAAAVPCTLVSAAVWTRKAGGNAAVALMVTVVTNLICFLLTPFWIYVSTRTLTELSPVDLIAKLGLLVVLPMVLAQLLRQSHLIASWADVRGKSLSTAAQCGILFMVLIGSVGCGMELAKRAVGDELRQVDFIAMLVVVLVVHVTMFGVGFAMAGMFRMSRPDRIAVGFAGSQKTLAVGVYIASFLPGMALLPIVSYHVIQLVVDTVIAERLAAQVPGEAHETEVRRAAH